MLGMSHRRRGHVCLDWRHPTVWQHRVRVNPPHNGASPATGVLRAAVSCRGSQPVAAAVPTWA
eukprot:357241-Chlamydomonas_euryale.AAC.10